VVERGPADEVILNPQHEYTKLLAEAAPNPERRISELRG
jgi:ABC-type oligopeptide transport system ATPase subunit